MCIMDDRAIAEALRARMGGHLLSMELEGELEGVEERPACPLTKALLTLFCWSDLSLPQISWLARCARESDPNHEDLKEIAQLGSWGKFPGNMRRDLLRWFTSDLVMPKPLRIDDVPSVDNVGQKVLVEQSIMPLVDFVETLFRKPPRCVGPDVRP